MIISMAAITSCASGNSDKSIADEPADILYLKATDALERGDFEEAVKYFSEVDRQHPYSQWAVRAELMEAYAHYQNMDYDSAIVALDNFIEMHPGNKDIGYAFYLRALSNYERILDVKRDQSYAKEAMRNLREVMDRFRGTEYAKDAALKLSLINDHLAGAEMEVGRYYLRQKQYLAAQGRFRAVIDNYQTTSHVPEALQRLVEIYLALGFTEEAKKSAALLGYNFSGSDWYKDAYDLLKTNGVLMDQVLEKDKY